MSSKATPHIGCGSSDATVDETRRAEINAKQQLNIVNIMSVIGRNHYEIDMMNPKHTTHASAAPLAPTTHMRADTSQ